ncbi:MAG TPA: hypothetical protein VJU83_11245 [Burkholderiales bacterium]|nr:hypothetical protein [Burkholderiales bacterium]
MKTFNTTRSILSAALLATFALSITPVPGNAADFPQRVEIGKRSAASGVGLAEVPLLKRHLGPGMEIVAEQLLSDLSKAEDPVHTHGDFKLERADKKMALIGEGWKLQIYGDGTTVKYRNYDYLDGPGRKPLALASRPTQAKLESLGRKFIETKLGRHVQLDKNETLVPYFTQFQIDGGGSIAPGAKPDPEKVMASTVIFARAVDGVPVLGPGSKIAVLFANDGKPVGFDMDWAVYDRTGEMQKVASLKEVQGRMKGLLPFDLGATDVKTTRFECGYFDLGGRQRDADAPLQSACLIHTHKRDVFDKLAYAKDPKSGHSVHAHMGAIPAGVKVELDKSWPQALILLGMEPPKQEPPEEQRPR